MSHNAMHQNEDIFTNFIQSLNPITKKDRSNDRKLEN